MKYPTRMLRTSVLSCCLLCTYTLAQGVTFTEITNTRLSALFYSDASCLLSIDSVSQPGKTVIDADVDESGSRMLIHCDTEDGRRLTLLARGDSLNLEQRTPLLDREQIAEGESGMIAWLTRKGVHYTNDTVPRRYVVGGSVKLHNSPSTDISSAAVNASKQSFGAINGTLEPLQPDSHPLIYAPAAESDIGDDSESAVRQYVTPPDNLSAKLDRLILPEDTH